MPRGNQNHSLERETTIGYASVTSGTTAINSAPVLNDAESVEFDIHWGAMAGGDQTILLQGSNNGTDWTTIETIDVESDDHASKISKIEVVQATYKYLRVSLPRTNAAALNSIVCHKFDPRLHPAPLGDSTLRRVVAYPPNLLPNSQAVARSYNE